VEPKYIQIQHKNRSNIFNVRKNSIKKYNFGGPVRHLYDAIVSVNNTTYSIKVNSGLKKPIKAPNSNVILLTKTYYGIMILSRRIN